MKIYQYNSYDEYVAAQIKANKRKLNNSYVDPVSLEYTLENLVELYNFLPQSVICHGTRRGEEQKIISNFYKKYDLDISIIGTEISPTAEKFPDTIQWDFHDVKDEWLSSIDLIYSNAFDHSLNPVKCLDAWMSCLSEKGICIIEYSPDCDTKSSLYDPFGATLDEYKNLINKNYNILTVLDNIQLEGKDRGSTHRGKRYYFCIVNRNEN